MGKVKSDMKTPSSPFKATSRPNGLRSGGRPRKSMPPLAGRGAQASSPLAAKGSLSDSQTLFNKGPSTSGLLTRAASRAANASGAGDDDSNAVISETEDEASQEPSQEPSQDPSLDPMLQRGRQPLASLFPPPQSLRPAQGSSDIIMATIHTHLVNLGGSHKKDLNECESIQKDIRRYMEARTKEKQKAREVHSELKKLQVQLENARTALTKLAATIEFN